MKLALIFLLNLIIVIIADTFHTYFAGFLAGAATIWIFDDFAWPIIKEMMRENKR